MKRVIVHIDRLVLKGFDVEDQHRIAADLQAELGRTLAVPKMHEWLAGLRNVQHIQVGATNTDPSAKTASHGTSAARAIVRSLKQ